MSVEVSQPMSALAKANRIRLARSKLMGRLSAMEPHAGCLWAADLIVDPPEILESMELLDFLVKIRRLGTHGGERLLAAVGLRTDKRLGDLTPAQRAGVAGALRYRAAFWGVPVERAA